MCMSHIVTCGLSGSDIFFHIFSQIAGFSEKKNYGTWNVFWFAVQLLSEMFLILRRTQWDTVTDYTGLHVKYPLFSSDFNESWIFSTKFSKNVQILNLMKIRPVGAELFHADGRAERPDEANSRFSQFCKDAYKWF